MNSAQRFIELYTKQNLQNHFYLTYGKYFPRNMVIFNEIAEEMHKKFENGSIFDNSMSSKIDITPSLTILHVFYGKLYPNVFYYREVNRFIGLID
jgi:hypothetical protein